MDDTDLMLDGNAAAGLLSELFVFETTAAMVTCASCGARGPVGATHVYDDRGPGMVLRCPHCSAMLLRAARIRGRMVADLRGVARLEPSG
jgi:ribosomal protein S27E